MPTPAITNGEEQFFVTTYEGNGEGQKVGKFVPFTDNATIDNSCIFDSASNPSLTRTPGSAGNRKTFTVSFWVKRGRLGDQAGSNTYGQRIFHAADSSSAFFDIKFSGSGDTEGANRLHLREYSSSAEQIEYWTNRTFEDTSKWYNIVVTHTQGSPLTFYINGVSVHTTANDSTTHTFDNWSFGAGNVSSSYSGDSEEFDGYMSSILIYNRALTAAEVTQNYNATKGRYGY